MVTGDQYCDCSTGGDTPLSCPEAEVFCDLIGDCIHVFEVWVYILYVYKNNRLKLDLDFELDNIHPCFEDNCAEAEFCCDQVITIMIMIIMMIII